MPSPQNRFVFLLALFRDGPPAGERVRHVRFVGKALGAALRPLEVGQDVLDDPEGAKLVSAAGVDAYLRLMREAADVDPGPQADSMSDDES